MDQKTARLYAASGLRLPQRKQGIDRFDALLDAAHVLLSEDSVREISLADVAREADVPLPSLYHFFANRNALLVALANRHLRNLERVGLTPLDPRPLTWQDYLRARLRNGAAYLNANPDALRLFMGAGVSAEVRMMDLAGNLGIAARRANQMRELFDCSSLDDLEGWMGYATAMADGIWSHSWSQHRRITEDAIDEASRALVAYLRIFLPERLPPREWPE